METLTTGWGYHMPTRLIFGVGKLSLIGREVAKIGRRALLVTGKNSAQKYGYTQRAVEQLQSNGVHALVFDGVESNPTSTVINAGGQLARQEKCDVIVGLGGGSALDAAKSIAVVAAKDVDIWEVVVGAPLDTEVLPTVAIPTTAGTGSEATQYAVISNRELRRKDALASVHIYPKLAILDPELTLTLDRYYTASAGMDVIAHATEAYSSALANELSDLLAIEAIRLAAQNLRLAVWNGSDLTARSNMMLASTLAGMALAQADTTIAHTIGEAVGAIYNTDHGTSVALVLPAVMQYNCIANLRKYAFMAQLLGENTDGLSLREAALKSADAVRSLIQDVGLPSGLGAIGVTDISAVMRLVNRPGMTASNPRAIGSAELQMLVERSL
jgi:alcohol dehydrogenase